MTEQQSRFHAETRTVAVYGMKAEAHEEWQMRRYDWRRIVDELDQCKPPAVWLQTAASIALGIAVTAVFAAVAAIASEPEPVRVAGRVIQPQQSFEYLPVVYWVVAIAAAIFAVVFFKIDHDRREEYEQDTRHVLRHMREIEEMFGAPGTAP